ncbi:MAG: hypothetical protein PUC44_05240 [Eubacteriales bacterium]|nr:hypothetical protein [Eubacteriales bacterium]
MIQQCDGNRYSPIKVECFCPNEIEDLSEFFLRKIGEACERGGEILCDREAGESLFTILKDLSVKVRANIKMIDLTRPQDVMRQTGSCATILCSDRPMERSELYEMVRLSARFELSIIVPNSNGNYFVISKKTTRNNSRFFRVDWKRVAAK